MRSLNFELRDVRAEVESQEASGGPI